MFQVQSAIAAEAMQSRSSAHLIGGSTYYDAFTRRYRVGILVRSFLRGLVFVVPVGATVYILYLILSWIDNLVDPKAILGVDLPGLGIALTIVLITVAGFFTSLFVTRWVVGLTERFFERMPVAKLIYSAIKDMLEAFVGEKRKFDRPVVVSLGAAVGGEIVGFITSEDLGWLGREGKVAVYFPQSYNFAGSVVIFPRDRVQGIEGEPSAVMQFIVSGGVSGHHGS
jgi:uncharacterized membrane protein